MASLTDAYERVRAQTQENNAASEEDGGAMQEVFAGILGTLTNDLDPKNVEEPLSDFGKVVDWLVPFKQKQIEAEAERQAGIAEVKFGAGANLRRMSAAEELDNRLTTQAASNLFANNTLYGEQRATLNAKESVKSFMDDAVKASPVLAKDIANLNTDKDRSLFQVFEKGVNPGVGAGKLVYTNPNGQQLYATADDDAKNINYHHGRISTNMRLNIAGAVKDGGLSLDRIKELYSSVKGRAELFADPKFKEAVKKTIEEVPKELLASHSIYKGALKRKMTLIDKSLSDRSTLTNQQIFKQQRSIEAWKTKNLHLVVAGTANTYLDGEEAKLTALLDKQLKNSLNGSFLQKFQSMVNEKAFVLSLLKGQKVNVDRADINVDEALRLVMNNPDPELSKYRKDLEYFYGIESKKLKEASKDPAPPPAPPPAGSGEKPPSATNKSEQLGG